MRIDWIFLIASSVLLLVPASWLYPATGKERLTSWHSARFRLEAMLGTWQHWLDLARGFGGAFFLTNAAVLMDPAIAGDGDRILYLLIIWGVLGLAVFSQTVNYRQVFYFTAPIFFIWGVTLALVGWMPAVFGIIFSTVLARLLNHLELKLPLMAELVGAAGYEIDGFSMRLALTCGLILAPVVIAFACMNHLVCYTRDLTEE